MKSKNIRCLLYIVLVFLLFGKPIHSKAMAVTSKSEAEAYIRSSLLSRQRIIKLECSGPLITGGLGKFIKNVARKELKGNSTSGDYLCHLLGAGFYSTYKINGTYHYTIQVSYKETVDQTKAVDRRIKSIVKQTRKMTVYEKIKHLSNWIVRYLQYSYKNDWNTAYDAVIHKQVKCMGYSMLAQKMFTEAGVKSKIILGDIKGGERHAWNAVQIGKKYYYVDTCWMDSGPGGKKPNAKYFLFGEKKCRRERTILQGYEVLKISKKRYCP